MKIYTYLENLFESSDFELEVLPKGLTNKNYLCHIDGQTYVVRVPYSFSDSFIDRKIEKDATLYFDRSNMGFPTIYFDTVTGIKISVFQKGCKEFSTPYTDEQIIKVAKKLKEFHACRYKINVDFHPIEKLKLYSSKLPIESIHPSEHQIIQEVEKLNYDSILCHNDLVAGNLLFQENNLFIIDYEYASDNDPLFDVISFLSENNITSNETRNLFYFHYFDRLSENSLHRLVIWESFQNLLWYYWALMMHQNKQEIIYLQIAQEKKEALANSLCWV